MNALLSSSWLSPFVGTILYLATTAALLAPGRFRLPDEAAMSPQVSPSIDPSWKFRNPEFEQWVSELQAERKLLAERQAALAELEARLQAERQEIMTATQAIANLQQEFDRHIIRFKDGEKENLKRQVKVVSSMSVEGAATLLTQMPEREMVLLIYNLRPDQTAGILDAMSRTGPEGAKTAANIAERLRSVLPDTEPTTR